MRDIINPSCNRIIIFTLLFLSSLRRHQAFVVVGRQQYYHRTNSIAMPRGVKKENLPSKVCVICHRPFTWRKKWERCWDEVTTCSKSCNRQRRNNKQQQRTATTMLQGAITDIDDFEDKSSGDGDESKSPVERDLEALFKEAKLNDNRSKASVNDIDAVSLEDPFKLSTLEDDLISLSSCSDNSNANSDDVNTNQQDEVDDPVARRKAERKAAKKARKAARRAQREDASAGQKQCDMCSKSVDLLIRCTYDESQQWKMVCGKCWNIASGGVVDGDSNHPYYRYGGLWKNRRKR